MKRFNFTKYGLTTVIVCEDSAEKEFRNKNSFSKKTRLSNILNLTENTSEESLTIRDLTNRLRYFRFMEFYSWENL